MGKATMEMVAYFLVSSVFAFTVFMAAEYILVSRGALRQWPPWWFFVVLCACHGIVSTAVHQTISAGLSRLVIAEFAGLLVPVALIVLQIRAHSILLESTDSSESSPQPLAARRPEGGTRADTEIAAGAIESPGTRAETPHHYQQPTLLNERDVSNGGEE